MSSIEHGGTGTIFQSGGYQHTLQFYEKIFWNEAIAQVNLTKMIVQAIA